MKARLILLGVALGIGGLWSALTPQSAPPPLAFTYRETALEMDGRTGVYVRIDLTVPAGRTAVIEWSPLPGWQMLPIHEISAPFPFASDEMFHRFTGADDPVGFYNVRLK